MSNKQYRVVCVCGSTSKEVMCTDNADEAWLHLLLTIGVIKKHQLIGMKVYWLY